MDFELFKFIFYITLFERYSIYHIRVRPFLYWICMLEGGGESLTTSFLCGQSISRTRNLACGLPHNLAFTSFPASFSEYPFKVLRDQTRIWNHHFSWYCLVTCKNWRNQQNDGFIKNKYIFYNYCDRNLIGVIAEKIIFSMCVWNV